MGPQDFTTREVSKTKFSEFISYTKTKLKNTTNNIIGVLFLAILAGLAGLVIFNGSTPPPVETVSAAYPPEAQALADQIQQQVDEYPELMQQLKDIQLEIRRGSSTAAANEVKLCSEYQLRYDRDAQQLVTDDACPLL